MASFTKLTETINRLNYEQGFRDGYLAKTKQELLLKNVTIGDVTGKFFGWMFRFKYRQVLGILMRKVSATGRIGKKGVYFL